SQLKVVMGENRRFLHENRAFFSNNRAFFHCFSRASTTKNCNLPRRRMTRRPPRRRPRPSPLAGEGGAKRRMRGRFSGSNDRIGFADPQPPLLRPPPHPSRPQPVERRASFDALWASHLLPEGEKERQQSAARI